MYIFIGSIETHRISSHLIASTVYATIFVCARTVALEVVDKPRMATFRRPKRRWSSMDWIKGKFTGKPHI